MLPQHYRFPLRQHADFFKSSQRKYGSFVTWFYQPLRENLELKNSRVAIIIPRKVAKKSTTRHAWKRKIKAFLIPYLTKNTLKNLDLVISVKTVPIDEQTFFTTMKKEIETFLNL